LACDHFRANIKQVRFKAGISDGNRWKIMTPFSRTDGNAVPDWWMHYNKLKHDKVDIYFNCTLIDLVNAIGALYILMNYLLIYQKENIPIQYSDYTHFRKNGGKTPYEAFLCAYQSKFFEVTTFNQNVLLAIILPEVISDDQLKNVAATNYFQQTLFAIPQSPKIWEALGGPLKEAKLSSMEWGHPDDPAPMIFYSFLDYQQIMDIDSQKQLWRLGCFAIFCN
jgi:hypothetical protein